MQPGTSPPVVTSPLDLGPILKPWAAALAGPLGGAVELSLEEMGSASLKEWLEGRPDWALGSVEVAWDGTSQLALLAVSRAELERLAGEPAAGAAAEEQAWLGLLGEVLRCAADALLALPRAAALALSCNPGWTLPTPDLKELAALGLDALPDQARVARCAFRSATGASGTFHLALPEEFCVAVESLSPPDPSDGTPVVALVAFDPQLRRELKSALQADAPRVAEFPDLRAYLQSHAPARTRLIVLGLSLENRTALEQCRAIKRDAALKAVPVLMCAPAATRDLFLEAMGAGAQGFAVAPFENSIPTQLRRLEVTG